MSRKPTSRRRLFEIDMPDAPAGAPTEPNAGQAAGRRRGPMATAIGEAASALGDRRAAENAIRAENDALAHEHARLKRLGLVLETIPLGAISTRKLTRDRRVAAIDHDLGELKESIREIGLSNPIRVEAVEDDGTGAGGFELIQGLRRLTAFRALHEETGDEAWATIPAALVQPNETMEGLYRRMVDENLVRKDVSFAEMAMLAEAYAGDPETNAATVDEAVKTLFKSAGYQKRSYIRAFAGLMARIGDSLVFPEAVSRNLGLALRARMDAAPELAEALRRALAGLGADRSMEEERALLRRFAEDDPASLGAAAPPALAPGGGSKAGQTRFTLARPGGEARVAARGGRLEIKGPEDFAAYGPDALARAVDAFYRALEE